MAFQADMESRRRVRNAQPGLTRLMRTLSNWGTPHANSVLQPTIDHAVRSVRGHPNATLVADTIQTNNDVVTRLRHRESPYRGESNFDALRRDLDRLRQTQPLSPSAPASATTDT